MTNDALAVLLQRFIDLPMRLALFEKGPRANAKNPSLDDFELCSCCEPFNVLRKNWKVDEAKLEARCERWEFTFTERGRMIAGWVLTLVDEDVVVDFAAYDKPYPINGGDEVIRAEPWIKLSGINRAQALR